MNTAARAAARAFSAAAAFLTAALLAGAHRPDPITCSVSSVSVVKVIPVESAESEPATILNVEVEPRGPRSALLSSEPPTVTSVTDAAGKEILAPGRSGLPMATRAGRPQSPREQLIATIRRAVRPDLPPSYTPPPPSFHLDAFPSTIKDLKGNVVVLTGEEDVVPLEIAEGKGAVEVSPGVTFEITKVTESKQVRFADFQIRIRKPQSSDDSGLGEEPVVVGLTRRKGGKELPDHMHDQMREKEETDDYLIASPPPLMLTDGDGTPTTWQLRLIRNIRRTKVEFECQNVVVRPPR
jgi:hypothetical protein